jgi:hypothetical protein
MAVPADLVASGLLETLRGSGEEEHDMQAVVGVIREHPLVEQIVEALQEMKIANRHISVLSPGSSEAAIRHVPTTEAESPGIGQAIGSVVGGAAGSAGGLAVASVALPGVGPVLAAGTIALGLLGAIAGGAVGGHLDDALSHGLPTDELYVYRDALQKGRSIVVAMAEDDAQATRVRKLLAGLGAESVDAARDEWWIGLRDAEEAEYTRQGGDFRKDETLYRMGFDAAFRVPGRDASLDDGTATLRERYGADADHLAFRAGYARGRAHRSVSEERGGDRRSATDGHT